MDNYIITIARSFGSGGKEIASLLSEKLGIPWYERQILTMASQASGIDESEFVEVDERLHGSYLIKSLTRTVAYAVMYNCRQVCGLHIKRKIKCIQRFCRRILR